MFENHLLIYFFFFTSMEHKRSPTICLPYNETCSKRGIFSVNNTEFQSGLHSKATVILQKTLSILSMCRMVKIDGHLWMLAV